MNKVVVLSSPFAVAEAKKYDSHYQSFNINNKLAFVNNFQFLSSSLDNLVKTLSKDDFNYLSK